MSMTVKNLTYFDNKEEHGPIYDWGAVFREYRKLNVPGGLYDPTRTPVDKAHICDIISIRARGKTTGWLLIGMILNQMYGCTTAYVRQVEDMTAPVNARELFDVICTYKRGYYVEQITKGEYNSIMIQDRRAYFCRVNEMGEVTAKAENPWLNLLSIDRAPFYKSALNLPNCNLIIFDEFISPRYADNEFVQFNDLLSTVIRKRRTPIVVMLANNITSQSPYFREQEISKEVKKMQIGDAKILYSSKGTAIYVEIDKPPKTNRHNSIVNQLFFGFSNPRLAAITGDTTNAWVFDIYPHITHCDDEKVIDRKLYIDVSGDLLNVEITQRDDLGLVANIHPAFYTYKDSTILTTGEIDDIRKQYATGFSAAAIVLWKLYKQNRVFFSDNETGATFLQYVDMCKLSRR